MSLLHVLANPRAIIHGRAIGIDMSSVGSSFYGKHMSLFFRPSGFDTRELEDVNRILENYPKRQFSFALAPWGRRSKLVSGELEQLGITIREMFPQWQSAGDRPLHIEMN